MYDLHHVSTLAPLPQDGSQLSLSSYLILFLFLDLLFSHSLQFFALFSSPILYSLFKPHFYFFLYIEPTFYIILDFFSIGV